MSAWPGSRPAPYYASSLIGREAELKLLRSLIADAATPLITLTGTAGVGKTRLAAAIAHELTTTDILFVSLATVRDVDLVLPEIGRYLDLTGDDLIESIRARLSDWNGILILDNFEQVIDAASLIAEIFPHNPNLTMMVTSQRPLQIDGEQVVRLTPLEVPEAESDTATIRSVPSVQLMIDRALHQDATLNETLHEKESILAVAEICRKLDGLPLAIELAASRLVSLSPEMVLDQLEQGPRILSTLRRDTPERQRTMHSAISWSYELLPEEMQQVFLWLGTFSSGFDLAIVERASSELNVSIPSFDIVSELMNLSLIQCTSRGANPWYQMLESIRGFCLAALDESGGRVGAEACVTDYVLDLAMRSREELSGPNIGEWMARLARERATIRGAVRWGLEHEDPRVPMSVGARMFPFFEQEGAWREVVNWIDTAYQWHDKLPMEDVINALISKISMHETAHDLENVADTDELVAHLLSQYDFPILEMRYLVVTGNIAIDQQEWETAEAKYARVLGLGEENNFVPAISTALANLGNIAQHRGNHDAAEAYLLRALPLFDEIGNMHNSAQALSNLASIATSRGNYKDALAYLDRATDIIEELGLRHPRVYNLLAIASVNLGLLQLDAADAAASEAISEAQDLGFHQLEVMGYLRLAFSGLQREDIDGVYRNVRRALAAQEKAHGSQEYVELGTLVASALELERRHTEAVPILGKSLAWGREIEHSPDLHARTGLEALQSRLRDRVPEYDQLIESGEAWSEQTFIQVLNRSVRKHRSKPATLLVKIPERTTAPLDQLTQRENEILQLLINGKSTQGMADHLSLSPRTVTTHIGNIMGKLGVSSRAELVAFALRNTT